MLSILSEMKSGSPVAQKTTPAKHDAKLKELLFGFKNERKLIWSTKRVSNIGSNWLLKILKKKKKTEKNVEGTFWF